MSNKIDLDLPNNMIIWDGTVEDLEEETEDTMIIESIKFKVKSYKLENEKWGYRIPLEDNGRLFRRFNKVIQDVRDNKIGEKEKQFNMVQFSSFAKMDNDLCFFGDEGFYIMNDHIVFEHLEDEGLNPLERMTKFISYYADELQVEGKDKDEILDPLAELEMV